MHLAWSRIDQETLLARPLPFYKTRLKNICRELEKHFRLTPVRNERESSIQYAPTRDEEQQARRLGIDIHEVRESIRDCFERSDCGRSFQTALTNLQMTLARGERRDFLVIDQCGGLHALGKRILGISAAEIRRRLADLPVDQVPTVEEARDLIRRQQPETMNTAYLPEPVIAMEPTPCIEDEDGQGSDLHDADLVQRLDCTTFSVRIIEPKQRYQATLVPPEIPMGRRPAEPSEQRAPAPLCPQPAVQDRPRFTDVLKRQFRALVKALTRRQPSLQTKKRRRGETVSSFHLAARNILRPFSRVHLISHATSFLQDTLAWFHLWDCTKSADECEAFEQPGGREENYLFPQP
jgi:hypothetical protein